MSCYLKLRHFEGPLDLLVQLVVKAETDIQEISLSQITAQYLAYLAGLPELDIDQASEFVQLAATLLEIKARRVLPHPVRLREEEAELDLEEEEDTSSSGEGRVTHLAEYRKFKALAAVLRNREEAWGKVYTRPAPESLSKGHLRSLPSGAISVSALVEALQQVLLGLEENEPVLEVSREEITLVKQMEHIIQRLESDLNPVSFEALFSGIRTRERLIITFLALLELIRLQRIQVTQQETLGPIFIELRLN
ncbi:MAG: segregation/condensation protein A [Syntrophomonadaceae bacterium]|nr:segregation/condensation protein A [Syntrophomonadaceae bacterium]